MWEDNNYGGDKYVDVDASANQAYDIGWWDGDNEISSIKNNTSYYVCVYPSDYTWGGGYIVIGPNSSVGNLAQSHGFDNEVVAVVGPSGCGKSTLLQVFATLLAPDEGQVEFEGRGLRGLSDRALSGIRLRRFGFAFQFGELVPELTLRENVELPLRLLGTPLRETSARCTEILDELDITDHAGRRPNEVSGGQAQRAAIARAMIHRPAVLFADEPTGALDGKSGAAVLDALLGIARLRGTAVLIVTHDQTIAGHADRVIEMRDGSIYGESGVTV